MLMDSGILVVKYRMRGQFLLLLISSLILPTISSFCGTTGVPYSFEVLPSGAPVLGCAQPSCVANPDDKQDDSNFLVDANGQTDGFLRENDKESKRYGGSYGNKLIANCSGKFTDLTCPRKDQWVGGIEYIDHPRQPLILQCCTFAGLRFSQEVGVTNVGPGEAITGGEVIRDGRQISFDVIANARKVVDANTHVVSYEVTVRRMNCLPDPPEPVVDFEKGVSEEVVKVLTKATSRAILQKQKIPKKEENVEETKGDKALAAPLQKTDDRKQQKKMMGLEGKENIIANLPNGSQAVQLQQQHVETQSANQPAFPTPSATHSEAQPTLVTGDGHNLQVGAGGTGNIPSGSLGFNNNQVPPGFQDQQFTFGQPQENAIGSQGFQLPHAVFDPRFGSGQQVSGPNQLGSYPQFQPAAPQFYRPCATDCNRAPCNLQRCNEGRDPIFGIPTFAPSLFPTLSFPTLPPHSFPTFPPHNFQTPVPNVFPTPAPQTYPAIAPAPAYLPSHFSSFGSGSVPAFGAPTHVAANIPREILGDSAGSRNLTPLAVPTADAVNATPALGSIPPGGAVPSGASVLSGGQLSAAGTSFTPLPSFEDFMARLGIHNMSFPTFAPMTFGRTTSVLPVFTTASPPPPPPLPAVAAGYAAVPQTHPQKLVFHGVDAAPTMNEPASGSSVFYASQQWSPPISDFTNNALPQSAAAFHHL